MRTGVVIFLLAGRALAQGAPPPAAETPPAAPPAEAPPAGAPPAEAPPAEIQAGELSKLPKQTKFVEADYPKDAFDKGITADVILLLDINAEGTVDSVGIAEPATVPDMGFEEAAMAAAQQFVFEPAEMEGKPIAVQITYRYRFTISPKVPLPPPPGAEGAPPPAKEPVVNFKGALKERGTRTPLAGVVVTVFREEEGKPVGFEASSDEAGNFQLFDLAAGEWKVLVEVPGYYPFRTTEEIVPGELLDVTYYVEKASYNPFDVMVTAPRPKKEVSRTVLTAKEIEKVPGAVGDPLAVIQNLAGVARVAGFLVVRGSAPEDTQIFVDGATVPLIYHFGGLRTVLPVGVLDSVEFYPGNFAPMYGRATGGIIDVRIKDLKPEKVSGYVDVNILDAGAFVEAPIGDNAAIAIGARRSYIDFILNAAIPDDAAISFATAPRYYDYQVMGNWRPGPAHHLQAVLFGADDRLKILFKNPADLDPGLTSAALGASTTFYRSIWSYRYVPNERFENDFEISQGRNWFKFNAGSLKFKLNTYNAQIRDSVHQKITDAVSLTYGVDVLYGVADVFVELPPPPKEGEPIGNFNLGDPIVTESNGITLWSPAFFVEGELELMKGLLLLPGLRFDYFERVHQSVLEPRFTARYQLMEPLALKAGVGLFVQEPTFDETDDNFGNPELQVEKAIHYSAGAEYKPLSYLTVDVTGFYKHMYSLVSGSDEIVERDGELRPLIYDNRGKGRVVGMEVTVKHDIAHNLFGWVAYTLSRAERTDSGASDNRLFDFDQTHILSAVVGYSLPRNWQVGGRVRFTSGNPRTPVTGSVWNATTDRYDPAYGPVNSKRNPNFFQADLRVDKKWIYQAWTLNAYIDLENTTSFQNSEDQREYSFDFSESRPTGGIPVIPILGLTAEF